MNVLSFHLILYLVFCAKINGQKTKKPWDEDWVDWFISSNSDQKLWKNDQVKGITWSFFLLFIRYSSEKWWTLIEVRIILISLYTNITLMSITTKTILLFHKKMPRRSVFFLILTKQKSLVLQWKKILLWIFCYASSPSSLYIIEMKSRSTLFIHFCANDYSKFLALLFDFIHPSFQINKKLKICSRFWSPFVKICFPRFFPQIKNLVWAVAKIFSIFVSELINISI